MKKDARPRTWHRTAMVLAGIFLVDLGYSGQGLFSLLIALVGLLLFATGALLSLNRGDRPLARSRGLRAATYLILGVATYATMQFHLATGTRHAASVIAACEAYKTRHGVFPTTLQQLVPEFLPAVPPAKYTIAYGDFTYWASSDKAHTLMYVTMAPFGRRLYHFEQGIWSQLD
jgi:hypothetical protein